MRRLLIAVAVLALTAGCGVQAVPAAEAPPVNGEPVVSAQAAKPVSLSIPSLKVTDEVVPVGLCKKKAPPRCEKGIGEIELPDISETGWYDLAPKPGEVGRAVLLSHVDWQGTPGAFKHLGSLKVGDRVSVTGEDGAVLAFAVYSVRPKLKKVDYSKATVPLLFSPTNGRELGLITCSGEVAGGQYSDNTVVLARLVA